MTQANLSETLFKPRFKHTETSTLVRRFNRGSQPPMQSALDGKNVPHWYRMINRLMWIWRGVDPREILDVQARIVMSDAERTDDDLYDTVIGYRGGNWIYEWAKQAMDWQQKACQEQDAMRSGRYWLHASTLYNIAAYPHLKGDELAEQAQALANRAYEEAAQRLPGSLREMEFAVLAVRLSPRFYICRKGMVRFRRCSCAAAWTPCKPTITPCMNAISRRAVSRC